MNAESIIIGVLFIAAVYYLLRKTVFKPASGKPGSGCDKCPK